MKDKLFTRKSVAYKRTAKIITASCLGFALLLGGSTYALWSATGTANTSATVSTGDLKVTAASVQQWFNVTTPTSPAVITDLSAYRLVPGQTLKLKQDLNIIVVGNNISGKLQVNIPNSTLSIPLMNQAKFTLSLLDKTGAVLGTITPAVNTSNSLALNVQNLPRTSSVGDLYTVEISVALPSTADNLTKLQTANLGDMSITLTQGPPIPPADTNTGTVSFFNTNQTMTAQGITVLPNGSLFAISGDFHGIYSMGANNGPVTVLTGMATTGFADGPKGVAKFANPRGLTSDSTGNLYTADMSNNRIRKVTSSGVASTFAGTGVAGATDGPALSAKFKSPSGLTFDKFSNLYVADTGNDSIRKITDGVVSTFATGILSPMYIDTDNQGNVYVNDGYYKILKITPEGVKSTYTTTVFVQGIAINKLTGTLYYTDNGLAVMQVKKDGTKSILAGSTTEPALVNGQGASARFSGACSLSIDNAGSLYVGSCGFGDRTIRIVQ